MRTAPVWKWTKTLDLPLKQRCMAFLTQYNGSHSGKKNVIKAKEAAVSFSYMLPCISSFLKHALREQFWEGKLCPWTAFLRRFGFFRVMEKDIHSFSQQWSKEVTKPFLSEKLVSFSSNSISSNAIGSDTSLSIYHQERKKKLQIQLAQHTFLRCYNLKQVP